MSTSIDDMYRLKCWLSLNFSYNLHAILASFVILVNITLLKLKTIVLFHVIDVSVYKHIDIAITCWGFLTFMLIQLNTNMKAK